MIGTTLAELNTIAEKAKIMYKLSINISAWFRLFVDHRGLLQKTLGIFIAVLVFTMLQVSTIYAQPHQGVLSKTELIYQQKQSQFNAKKQNLLRALQQASLQKVFLAEKNTSNKPINLKTVVWQINNQRDLKDHQLVFWDISSKSVVNALLNALPSPHKADNFEIDKAATENSRIEQGSIIAQFNSEEGLAIDRRFYGLVDQDLYIFYVVQDFYAGTQIKYTDPFLIFEEQINQENNLATMYYPNGSLKSYVVSNAEEDSNLSIKLEKDNKDTVLSLSINAIGPEFEQKNSLGFRVDFYPNGQLKRSLSKIINDLDDDPVFLVGLDKAREQWQSNGAIYYEKAWYENGQPEYEGACLTLFKNACDDASLKLGLWKRWYANGQLRFQGSLAGIGYNGDVYHSDEWQTWYLNGADKEKSTVDLTNSNISVGNRLNVTLYRRYINWYENGQAKEQGDLIVHASGIPYAIDESLSVGRYKQWTSWHANGQVMLQGSYRGVSEDKYSRTGQWLGFYADASPFMETFYNDNGERVGTWRYWHANGQLAYQIEYTSPAQKYTEGPISHQPPATVLRWNEQGEAQPVAQVAQVDRQQAQIPNQHYLQHWQVDGKTYEVNHYYLGQTAQGNAIFQDAYNDFQPAQASPSMQLNEQINEWDHYVTSGLRNDLHFLSEPYVIRQPLENTSTTWSLPNLVEGTLVLWYPPENQLPAQKRLEAQYANEQLHGTWRSWHADGQLFEEGSYVHGQRQGLWTTQHKSNYQTWQINYEKGVADLTSLSLLTKQGTKAIFADVELIDAQKTTEYFKAEHTQPRCSAQTLFRDGESFAVRRCLVGLTAQGDYVLRDLYETEYKQLLSVTTASLLNDWSELSRYLLLSTDDNAQLAFLSSLYVVSDLQLMVTDLWTLPRIKNARLTLWYAPAENQVRQQWEQANYENEALTGQWQSWYSNGKPKEEGHYKQGVPTGKWQHWGNTGQLTWQGEYENGIPLLATWVVNNKQGINEEQWFAVLVEQQAPFINMPFESKMYERVASIAMDAPEELDVLKPQTDWVKVYGITHDGGFLVQQFYENPKAGWVKAYAAMHEDGSGEQKYARASGTKRSEPYKISSRSQFPSELVATGLIVRYHPDGTLALKGWADGFSCMRSTWQYWDAQGKLLNTENYAKDSDCIPVMGEYH